MSCGQIIVPVSAQIPGIVKVAGPQASTRFLEFFVNTIRNENTRRAYSRAVADFLAWCEAQGLASIADVQPLHVGTYIEAMTRDPQISAPSIKLRLPAIRRLFDWLVTGNIGMVVNPAASVRGPSHVVRVGRTPVLDPAEARQLLDSIDVSTPIGLRDRALLGLMVYSFARIGAAVGMKVEDVCMYAKPPLLWPAIGSRPLMRPSSLNGPLASV